MANNIPFQPMGKTVALSCTGSSSNAAVVADSPSNQYYIVNTGNSSVLIVSGSSNAVTATLPTVGTPQYGVVVPPASSKTISNVQSSGTANVYFAGISTANTCAVYITPGEGF